MDKGDSLGFTLFFRPCATKATGASFFLEQWIVAATGTAKSAILFHQDFDGDSRKCEGNK